MRKVYNYIILLVYCLSFFILVLLGVGVVISIIFFFKNGVFIFPEDQIKRAIFFGFVTGVFAWAGIVIFKLIDKFKARKFPPSDQE